MCLQSPLSGRYLADIASICWAKTDLERNLQVTAVPQRGLNPCLKPQAFPLWPPVWSLFPEMTPSTGEDVDTVFFEIPNT